MGIFAAILPTLLSALVPVVSDGVRGVFNWVTGGSGANPANVKEAVELMTAETERLKAIAALDAPTGSVSKWVADLRASFRYLAAAVIILPFPFLLIYVAMHPQEDYVTFFEVYANQVAGPVFGFMFGQRLSLSLKRK